MIKFIKIKDESNIFDVTNITIDVLQHDISLPDLLEEFESFLKAVGYNLDGRRLDIVDED